MIFLTAALMLFICSIITAVLGFVIFAGSIAEIFKILFVVFIVLFLVSLVAGLLERP